MSSQFRFNNLRVKTTKQLNIAIKELVKYNFEPLTSVPKINDPLLEENTAAETRSHHGKPNTDLRKDEEEKPCIQDFDVGNVVGAGNFAKVHKALNKKSNEWVALKILKKESVAAMKHVDHILNERNVLRHLVLASEQAAQSPSSSRKSICPFIIRLISSFQDNDNLYFELEYVQGCSLLTQIRNGNEAVRDGFVFYA